MIRPNEIDIDFQPRPHSPYSTCAHHLPSKKHALDIPRSVFSDDGVRVWDGRLMAWVHEAPQDVPDSRSDHGRRWDTARGSNGSEWVVRDVATDVSIWRFRAHTFVEALAEKRRLCHLAGGKSGYCYLVEVI